MPSHVTNELKESVDSTSNDVGSDSLPPNATTDKTAFLACFSKAEDKAIMEKVDRRFLLLIGILYVTKNVGCVKHAQECLQCQRLTTPQIDYQNAANVKVLQVGQPRNIMSELKMSSNDYNWVQSIYFVSIAKRPNCQTANPNDNQIAYIVYEVTIKLLLKMVTPRLWQSRICFNLGNRARHAAVQSRESYYSVRFLLGMMEAGMFPGLAAQLTSWYRSDEMGKPIVWMFVLPLSLS